MWPKSHSSSNLCAVTMRPLRHSRVFFLTLESVTARRPRCTRFNVQTLVSQVSAHALQTTSRNLDSPSLFLLLCGMLPCVHGRRRRPPVNVVQRTMLNAQVCTYNVLASVIRHLGLFPPAVQQQFADYFCTSMWLFPTPPTSCSSRFSPLGTTASNACNARLNAQLGNQLPQKSCNMPSTLRTLHAQRP